MKLRLFISVCICLHQLILPAQDTSLVMKPVLQPDEFIAIVRQYHPLIKQSNIGIQKASAQILAARGEFDPYLYLNTDQKVFDGTNYYQHNNPALRIPTWYGIEVKAGLENNSGDNLNSEITSGKSSYAGVSVPLAKNLLMDKRRAQLQQAKIFKQQSYAERNIIVNDLLLDAYTSYWDWVRATKIYEITSGAVVVNEKRLSLIRTAYLLGDRPAIDTIEALAQLQNFQYLQAEAALQRKNAAVELSNFLWKENNEYYELPETVTAGNTWNEILIDTVSLPALSDKLSAVPITHPNLQYVRFKLSGLEVDRKLKFQELLPIVNMRANVLNKGYNVLKGIQTDGFYDNNNKFGIDIGIPLRFSKGRGEFKLARLKIQETNLELRMKQQDIENKIKYYFNALAGYQQQVKVYDAATKNYQALFRGEDIKFRAGESSLFLLNARENKVLEAVQKLVELKIKFYQTQAALLWASGELR